MLSLTQRNFKKIRDVLLRQQKKVEEEIKSVENDDPVLDKNAAMESSEPGTDSWMADVHGRAVAVKQNLQSMLKKIRQSLHDLRTGKYGKCSECGKYIEAERLAIMPTATLCISCTKKAAKK